MPYNIDITGEKLAGLKSCRNDARSFRRQGIGDLMFYMDRLRRYESNADRERYNEFYDGYIRGLKTIINSKTRVQMRKALIKSARKHENEVIADYYNGIADDCNYGDGGKK